MHRYLSTLLVAGCVLSIASCDGLLDPRDHTYDGPPVVEFAPVLPAGTYTRQVTFAAGSTGTQNTTVRVQYVGPSPTTDVNGQFAFAANSTAVSGTHFTMPAGYTIPAGSNRIDVPIELRGNALTNGQSVTLVLELAPGQGFGISQKYKQFTITIRKAAS